MEMIHATFITVLSYSLFYTQYLGKVGVVKKTQINNVVVMFPDGRW